MSEILEFIRSLTLSLLNNSQIIISMLLVILVAACFLGRYIELTKKLVLSSFGPIILTILGNVLLNLFFSEMPEEKVVFNYNGSGGTGVDAELFGNSITASAGGGVNINNTSNGTTDIILQSNARFTSTIGANTTTNNKITLSSDDGNVDIYTYRKIIRSGTTQTHENTYTFTPTGQLQGIQTPSSP